MRLAAAVILALAAAGAGPRGAVQAVAIRGMQFVPPALTLSRGDTVRWTNEDLVPHTVTADVPGPQSPVILPGGSWAWTPASPGQVDYGCRLHPAMRGALTVR